jgi:peptidoglycan-associated lipoprotein
MKHAIIRVTTILTLSATVILGGCHKSQVASTVPQPPPPAVPTASLTASPQAIDKGQSTTLSWETTNANDVSIEADGISTETLGAVEAHGSMQVTPGDSTTYKLYANGPGGTQIASARVTVSVPLPPQPAVSGPSEDELFGQNLKMSTSISIGGSFVPTSKLRSSGMLPS